MDVNDNGREVNHERLDNLRRGRGPIQEHIIDEFVAGRLSRRDFLKKGTAFGLSLPLLGGILEAKGLPGVRPRASAVSRARAASGGTIRAGIITPAGAINPLTIADEGGLELLGNVGEFLVEADQALGYLPWLATSWTPNAKADVWTFKIRQGVKYNNGNDMTVDDVVYSFKTQCNPKSGGSALSVFGGLLVPDGVVKVDDGTIAFHLETADGAFLDAVSSDNYNMIVVPNGFDYSNYPSQWVGTGHYMMQSYTTNVGATFVRNPYYWGKAAISSEVQWTFYASEEPMANALVANEIDCLDQFFVSTSPQLLTGAYNIIKLKGSGHRELSMRCDTGPFKSNLVRQAIALTLNRPQLVSSLFKGYADIGNDSPFAPCFPATVGPPAVPQRAQNIAMAKQLLAKAGYARGFSTPLITEQRQEMPELAQFIKTWAKEIGVDISLTIEQPDKYYGSAVYGTSDWLDGEMSMVDYGNRSTPNLFLNAPLMTFNKATGAGAWNAARFNDPAYDKLAQEYVAATNLPSQRSVAKQIELLLLDETPIIYPYFYNYLAATRKNVTGVYPTALSQFFLWNASVG
jgi:peptide/nickel transport system substrate-binding protein